MKLSECPTLFKAVIYLMERNGIGRTRSELDRDAVGDKEIPAGWEQRCRVADTEADRLASTMLSDHIPEDMLQDGPCEPNEDALEVLVDGEQGVAELLVVSTRCQILHEVLNSFFEGDLHDACLAD